MPVFLGTRAGAQGQGTPLIAASEAGDVAALKRLLSRGAGIEARDGRGRTALLAATHANRVEAARRLIAAGAGVDARQP
jgi:ankyrin repeat protein